jgi:histidinol phosphatase-like enzyme
MINVALSYMIGDADVDIKFGRAIGMKTIRVGVNKVRTLQSDYTTVDLLEAAKLIENKES